MHTYFCKRSTRFFEYDDRSKSQLLHVIAGWRQADISSRGMSIISGQGNVHWNCDLYKTLYYRLDTTVSSIRETVSIVRTESDMILTINMRGRGHIWL